MNHFVPQCICFFAALFGLCLDVREIGDMDEGIVEGGEDAGDAENELACEEPVLDSVLPANRCSGIPTFSDLRTEGDVLLRAALDLLFGCHLCCCIVESACLTK